MRKVKRRGAAELENEDFEHDVDFLLAAISEEREDLAWVNLLFYQDQFGVEATKRLDGLRAANATATADDVAKRLVEVFEIEELLQQRLATIVIALEFDDRFLHTNKNGNEAINSDVLAAFEARTPNVGWDKKSRSWRMKPPGSPPGRLLKLSENDDWFFD